VIEQIAKILDCIQICAPRTAQAALPWAIDALRDWREGNRAEINRRAQVFQDALAPLPEWKIESVGAYFAYLRHPFPEAGAQQVAEKLATERGVLCLPGSYFGPGQEGHLRVAIANVGSDVLQGLTERFKDLRL
jgi:aspartate/methionine/tyrosine aminotransferase